MITARSNHTATLLAIGKVLLAGGGGSSGITNSAELYDPASGANTATGSLISGREDHTATLLGNGKVLFAGGWSGSVALTNAEVYDPSTGTNTATGGLTSARYRHHATASGVTNSAELYDPGTGAWTLTGAMNTRREYHTLTLLPSGKVLAAGGNGVSGATNSAELYDPAAGTWKATGKLNNARYLHTATLLSNGKVLAAGGYGASGPTNSVELYDPATGVWTVTSALTTARYEHTATLLPNGKVLLAGGQTNGVPLSAAELYDVGLGFSSSWQPQIAALSSPLIPGGSLVITGSQFRGISEGSGGNSQDSPADYPVVQVRSVESGQTWFVLGASGTNWSTNFFASAPVSGLASGYALVTVFVNGIPSTASVLNINTVAVPVAITLTEAKTLPDGSFQFVFISSPGAVFTALGTTNLLLPLSSWTVLGGVTEGPPGRFQFTDPQATNSPQQFYRVRSQ